MADPIRITQLKHPAVFIATGFGAGLMPKAPGTAGTVIAIPFAYFMSMASLEVYFVITALTCVIGIWICDVAANHLGVHDHSGIVLDEVAGYFITMILAPEGWQWLLFGFVVFRIFDILKPWPISVLDKRVQGGLGIMLDDIVAGMFALAVMQICAYYLL